MNEKTTVILDIRGTLIEYWSTAKDQEPLYTEDGKAINRFQAGLRSFLDFAWPKIIALAGSPLDIIAVEDKGSYYRRMMYAGYKKKPESDPVRSQQCRLLEQHAKEILMSLGVTYMHVPNMEADDVIAMLCERLEGKKKVITVDKDLVQLVNKDVQVIRKWLPVYSFPIPDSDKVVIPKLLPLYLSLVGDSADTYGGVKGFGKSAFITLLDNFTTEELLALAAIAYNADRIALNNLAAGDSTGNKVRAKVYGLLQDNWDNWILMYRLARSYPEVGTDNLNPPVWECRMADKAIILDAFTNAKLPYMAASFIEQYAIQRTLVTVDNLSDCLEDFDFHLDNSRFVPWDYETTDRDGRFKAYKKKFVDALNSKITGVSFAVGQYLNQAYYFPINHADTANLGIEYVPALLETIGEKGKELIAHNTAFEQLITLSQLKMSLPSYGDTAMFAHGVDENGLIGLKALSARYLGYMQTSYNSLFGKEEVVPSEEELTAVGYDTDGDDTFVEEEEEATDMEGLSGLATLNYACDDSLVTGRLRVLFGYMSQVEGWYDHVKDNEPLASAALTEITYSGITIDLEEVAKQKESDERVVKECSDNIYRLLGENCQEPDLSGLERYLEDQRAYCRVIDGRARARGTDTGSSLGKLRDKMEVYTYFRPLEDKVTPYLFKYTPARLTRVTEQLGLPPIVSVSNKQIRQYVSEMVTDNEDTKEFLLALLQHVAGDEAIEVSLANLESVCRKYLQSFDKHEVVGTNVELSSNTFLTALLYVMLNLPIRIRTKVKPGTLRHKHGLSGSPSTDKSAVTFAIIYDCVDASWKKEVLENLAKYQKASTRISNYWTPWEIWRLGGDVLHPYFKRFGTKTRRPSSQNPNFNSIDKRGYVRRTVIPPFKDWVISSVDFSAQELRRLANRCLDTNLVAAFNGSPRIDPHALVGRGIAYHTLAHQEVVKVEDLQMGEGNKVDYDWFNKQRSIKGDIVGSFLESARGIAKVVNFGIPYGVTARSLSEQTRLPLEVAELALAENAESFPGIGHWKTDTINYAKYHGYIPTLFGMRRHCGNALSIGSKPEIGRWERQICNSDIQGGCGDYLGWVLAECHRVGLFGILHRDANGVRLEQRGKFRAVLYNALYDELLYSCHKDDYLEMIGVVREIMERPSQGDLVKQEVDCSFGLNWKDQYEVGRIPDPDNVNKIMRELFGDAHGN